MEQPRVTDPEPRKRVLVVEDDSWIRRFMCDLLADEGYDVLEAADGRTAIRIASELLPDAVLLDVTMPDVNGVDVVRHLRSRRRTRLLPVIVVSAYPRVLPPDSVASVSCVLEKPVPGDVLLAAVQDAIVPPAKVAVVDAGVGPVAPLRLSVPRAAFGP